MTTKIACIEKSAPNAHGHRHIVAVGVGDASRPVRQTVAQVRAALPTQTYYTVSPSTGKIALVTKYDCPSCGVYTIRSHGDVVTDNNLDNLGACRFN